MAFEASVLGDCQLHPRPPGVEVIPSWRGAMREAVSHHQSGGGAQHEPPRGVVEHDVAAEAAWGESAPLAVDGIEKHSAKVMRSSRVARCGGGLPQPVAESPAAPREAARFEEQSGSSEEDVELRAAQNPGGETAAQRFQTAQKVAPSGIFWRHEIDDGDASVAANNTSQFPQHLQRLREIGKSIAARRQMKGAAAVRQPLD